jgi:2-isopropylmalate synthase
LPEAGSVGHVKVHGRLETASAESNDPIVALDIALRKALLPVFPELVGVRFTDYRAHTRTQQENRAPVTRVLIESQDINLRSLGCWSTIGVADNVIDASLSAMHEAISYRVLCISLEKLRQVSA